MTSTGNRREGYPRGGGAAYTAHAAALQAKRRATIDKLRDLSSIARETRRPGQTLQARFRELEAEASR